MLSKEVHFNINNVVFSTITEFYSVISGSSIDFFRNIPPHVPYCFLPETKLLFQ